MIIIVIKFTKLRYNHLTMGIFTSGDIKIYKVDKLFGDINGVNMYIEYKLVLSK